MTGLCYLMEGGVKQTYILIVKPITETWAVFAARYSHLDIRARHTSSDVPVWPCMGVWEEPEVAEQNSNQVMGALARHYDNAKSIKKKKKENNKTKVLVFVSVSAADGSDEVHSRETLCIPPSRHTFPPYTWPHAQAGGVSKHAIRTGTRHHHCCGSRHQNSRGWGIHAAPRPAERAKAAT